MKTIIFCLLALFCLSTLAAKNLANNVDARCRAGCDWNDASIWEDGVVPRISDDVNFNDPDSYIINVNSDITVKSFTIGISVNNKETQRLIINSGTFTTTGKIQGYITSKITVAANATLVATDKANIQGTLEIAGTGRFRGSSPSLYIETKSLQVPGLVFNAILDLQNGQIMVSNDVEISSQSTLLGQGTIDGNVEQSGKMRPGNNAVGTITINGELECNSLAETYININSDDSFDKVIVSGRSDQDGNILVNLAYNPAQHHEFPVFTHDSRKGEYDRVFPEGKVFAKTWKVVSESKVTYVYYNSATSAVVSLTTFLVCIAYVLF